MWPQQPLVNICWRSIWVLFTIRMTTLQLHPIVRYPMGLKSFSRAKNQWLLSGWEMYHLPKKVSLRNAITQNPMTKRMSPEEFTHSTKGWLQPRWKCHWASSRGEKMHHFSDSQIGSSVFSLPIFLRSVVMRTFVMPNGGFCGSALSCCKES